MSADPTNTPPPAAAAQAEPKSAKKDPNAPRGKNESREAYNERTGKGPSAGDMAGRGKGGV